MIKTRTWPVRAMYILIAAALAMSLIMTGTFTRMVSADPGLSEWDRVSTPTTDDWVLAPESMIIDFAVAEDGEVAYAIVNSKYDMDGDLSDEGYCLLKSDDHAATWKDLTGDLKDQLDDDGYTLQSLLRVATDADDSDFVAVALRTNEAVVTNVHVYTSTDGGATFRDTDEVEDGGRYFNNPQDVADLAVSPEDDGERDIAIVGQDDQGNAAIFRCTVIGDFSTGWEDARYDGWDDDPDFSASPDPVSDYVTCVVFAPSWDADRTILVVTVQPGSTIQDAVYLQSGTWGTTEGWNAESVVAIDAVLIMDNVDTPTKFTAYDARALAGVTLPLDYSGRNSGERYAWVWVNYYDSGMDTWAGIYRVKDDEADPVGPMGQIEDGEVWLTNVSYLGYISEGKAIAGVGGDGEDNLAVCCEGVEVYYNDGIVNMDVCCIPWEEACKPPTGRAAMAAFYVSDDPASSKAYAVDLWGEFGYEEYDESAWSVSFDDGYVWNQLSLIDTDINYLSDVAVSPDCNKTMLVSVNIYDEMRNESCTCDSVWLHAETLPEAEEYSGQWLRTWCGELLGEDEAEKERGLLRLAPEETDGETVYLVDVGTDTVYWNEMETLWCWDKGTATVDNIVDLAVKDRETIFALDEGGTVAMSDDYALGWDLPVDSEIDQGSSIAVWDDDILVGGEDGDVSHSDDGGETFTEMEDVASSGYVSVAFDSYFDTSNRIYAAVASWSVASDSGVYRWVIGESEEWKDLRAEPLESQLGLAPDFLPGPSTGDDLLQVKFTGLVVDNADGNLMTDKDTGGVLYASYYYCGTTVNITGVARYLTPGEETICQECGDWDYLVEGLGENAGYEEVFAAWPDALKICGCLEPGCSMDDLDKCSKLFAIDFWNAYDMDEGEEGTVWTFLDCYAKGAPDLKSPANGATIAADPCTCYSVPFTLMWERMCDACSYIVQIALDEDFEELVDTIQIEGEDIAGDAPSYHLKGGAAGGLSCETTYYWRVRAKDAETGQYIRSWWSDHWSFSVAPSVGAGVNLVSPEAGATDVATTDIAFSWSEVATADEYNWLLSANTDLSPSIASEEGLTEAAAQYTGSALDYDTPYYWQVIALKDNVPISTSTIGTFRTMAEPDEPYVPPKEEIPVWVWVVIAIGAVLVIVVIVLIFRTRRV